MKTRRQIARALRIALLAAWVSTALAEGEFTPADFGDEEKSLARLMTFPELRGDTSVTISCIAILTSRGKLDQHGCYQRNPGDQTFIESINRAARKARLKPATYGGKAVDVVFQYRVHFEQKDDDRRLGLMANPGYKENVEAYGVEHIGAQRLIMKETWQKSCPRQNKFTVLARANVDWEGRPSAVTITHTEGIPITAKCEQALTETVLASRFIPAFADGEAVPSTFVEPFGN